MTTMELRNALPIIETIAKEISPDNWKAVSQKAVDEFDKQDIKNKEAVEALVRASAKTFGSPKIGRRKKVRSTSRVKKAKKFMTKNNLITKRSKGQNLPLEVALDILTKKFPVGKPFTRQQAQESLEVSASCADSKLARLTAKKLLKKVQEGIMVFYSVAPEKHFSKVITKTTPLKARSKITVTESPITTSVSVKSESQVSVSLYELGIKHGKELHDLLSNQKKE
jgi:hypothetical protein